MKINLILLAAGNSRRFEGNKLLTIVHECNGKSVKFIQHSQNVRV